MSSAKTLLIMLAGFILMVSYFEGYILGAPPECNSTFAENLIKELVDENPLVKLNIPLQINETNYDSRSGIRKCSTEAKGLLGDVLLEYSISFSDRKDRFFKFTESLMANYRIKYIMKIESITPMRGINASSGGWNLNSLLQGGGNAFGGNEPMQNIENSPEVSKPSKPVDEQKSIVIDEDAL